MTIYTMVGLPGSGKSTFCAQHPECAVVSTDGIRKELFGTEECQQNGWLVFKTAHERIQYNVENGIDTIFDATNVSRKYRKEFIGMYPTANHVAVFLNTPIEECKKRNANRARTVPDEVIDRMARKLTPPEKNEGFSKIIEITP